MAIFKITLHLFLILGIVTARLSSSRSIKKSSITRERELKASKQPKQSKVPWKSSKQPTQSKVPGNKRGKGTGPTGAIATRAPQPSLFCSVLPALDASAPKGAKRRLYGKCSQLDVISVPSVSLGYVSFGKCDLYTASSHTATSLIGTLRYELDASFGVGSGDFQYFSTTRLFVGAGSTHQVIISSSAIIASPLVLYFANPTTFIINSVGIDQGLGNQYDDDCNFSRYSRMVVSYNDINSPNINITFF